jgi:hypothetical protein
MSSRSNIQALRGALDWQYCYGNCNITYRLARRTPNSLRNLMRSGTHTAKRSVGAWILV